MFILLTLGLALVGWVGVGREGLKDTSVIAYSVKSRKTLRVDKKRTVWYKNKYEMYYSKLREQISHIKINVLLYLDKRQDWEKECNNNIIALSEQFVSKGILIALINPKISSFVLITNVLYVFGRVWSTSNISK